MKTILYYFSGTGNSLVVARDLAQALGTTELHAMTQGQTHELFADAVGFVFPVYMFGLPLIVRDFLDVVCIPEAAYVFTLATYGGMQGRPHSMARRILKRRGISAHAGFSVKMPGNYTPLYGAINRERQDALFAAAKGMIPDIAERIRARTPAHTAEKPFLTNFLLYALLYKGGSSQIKASAKGFWVTSACTKCGLCARVCPVHNIALREGIPVWSDHCQHCMACLQWCPVEAIQYRKSTQGRKRYHHPQATVQDMMEQSAHR